MPGSDLIKLLDARIEDVKEGVDKYEKEIEGVKQKLKPFLPVKIYTRKELRMMEFEKSKKEAERALYEKNNINSITFNSLIQASEIREKAKNSCEFEKKNAEIRALRIEVDAFSKEIDVKSKIINEKQVVAEKIMVDQAITEFRIKKCEREIKGNKKFITKDISGIKKEVSALKVKFSQNRERYFSILSQIESINVEISLTKNRFYEAQQKLNVLN